MNYDLEDRTAKFGESVLVFLKKVGYGPINTPLISQLTRSATSIGANYMEANQASSKRDFRNKITICKKESNESKHWFRMISKANPEYRSECQKFWKEAHELVLIFSKISASCGQNVSKIKN